MNIEEKPPHPGEILREDFLKARGITQQMLTDHMGCAYSTVTHIIHEQAPIRPRIAIALGEVFDIDPQCWLRAQMKWDLWRAMQKPNKLQVKPIVQVPRKKPFQDNTRHART